MPTLADLLAVNVFELDDWNFEGEANMFFMWKCLYTHIQVFSFKDLQLNMYLTYNFEIW